MKAYDEIWGLAEDNFGIITSAQAEELGVSRQNMRKMTKSGLLMRLCHGVYQVKHHVPTTNDVYAAAVAMVGEKGYLRGASVVALLNLVPTDPAFIYVGAANRVRRRLPDGYVVRDMKDSETTLYNGIRCQKLMAALREAREEGVIESDRIQTAVERANEEGLLTDEECSQFKD
jgi:predicted transcriptional regulator of viral defense system